MSLTSLPELLFGATAHADDEQLVALIDMGDHGQLLVDLEHGDAMLIRHIPADKVSRMLDGIAAEEANSGGTAPVDRVRSLPRRRRR